MENKVMSTNGFYYKLIGAFFGLFALIIRMYGDFTAIYFHTGYDPNVDMISFLGSGPGHLYFNYGLMCSGLIIMPFYISIAYILKNEFPEYTKVIQSYMILSLLSSVSVFLIGLFLALSNLIPNQLIYDFHAFFAIIAFLSGAYANVVSGRLMKKSKRFPTIFAYIGYAVAVLAILFLVTWHALIEWISTYSMIITQLILSIYMILKKM